MEQGESVLIAGGTGLIGERLAQLLIQEGYKVSLLSRKKHNHGNISVYVWDVERQSIDENAILRADYIINLAGEGIADGRWTEERKKRIIESRTQSAALLLNTCKKLNHFPKAYISAAAIGFYGDRGSEVLDEESERGEGFLAESCLAWENAAQNWIEVGVRTVICRIGIVLSVRGGALAETLKPIKFGLATYFGNGKQYTSWIHLDDLCGIFLRALEDEEMQGIFNAVAPNPVSNKEFTRYLSKAYSTPSLLIPVPSFILQLMLGESAAIVLTGCIVSSAKIEQQGFVFQFPEILPALKDLLYREI
jgi:uncharacterized protein